MRKVNLKWTPFELFGEVAWKRNELHLTFIHFRSISDLLCVVCVNYFQWILLTRDIVHSNNEISSKQNSSRSPTINRAWKSAERILSWLKLEEIFSENNSNYKEIETLAQRGEELICHNFCLQIRSRRKVKKGFEHVKLTRLQLLLYSINFSLKTLIFC